MTSVKSAIDVISSTYIFHMSHLKGLADAAKAELEAANDTIKSLSSTLEGTSEHIKSLTRTLDICRERAEVAEEIIRTLLPGLYEDGDSVVTIDDC